MLAEGGASEDVRSAFKMYNEWALQQPPPKKAQLALMLSAQQVDEPHDKPADSEMGAMLAGMKEIASGNVGAMAEMSKARLAASEKKLEARAEAQRLDRAAKAQEQRLEREAQAAAQQRDREAQAEARQLELKDREAARAAEAAKTDSQNSVLAGAVRSLAEMLPALVHGQPQQAAAPPLQQGPPQASAAPTFAEFADLPTLLRSIGKFSPEMCNKLLEAADDEFLELQDIQDAYLRGGYEVADARLQSISSQSGVRAKIIKAMFPLA